MYESYELVTMLLQKQVQEAVTKQRDYAVSAAFCVVCACACACVCVCMCVCVCVCACVCCVVS